MDNGMMELAQAAYLACEAGGYAQIWDRHLGDKKCGMEFYQAACRAFEAGG